MTVLQLVGTALVLGGCGGCGFAMAAECRNLEQNLRQTQNALEILQCEIECRLTPLPEICGILQSACPGPVGAFFGELRKELLLPDAGELYVCAGAAVSRIRDLPAPCKKILLELCATLGRYDAEAQLRAIVGAKDETLRTLEMLRAEQAGRIRSYRALGLCGGAALAILLL